MIIWGIDPFCVVTWSLFLHAVLLVACQVEVVLTSTLKFMTLFSKGFLEFLEQSLENPFSLVLLLH